MSSQQPVRRSARLSNKKCVNYKSLMPSRCLTSRRRAKWRWETTDEFIERLSKLTPTDKGYHSAQALLHVLVVEPDSSHDLTIDEFLSRQD